MQTSNQAGKAARILGLPPMTHRRLVRSVALAGYSSLSEWLQRSARDFIRQQQAIYGDVLVAATPLELEVLRVIGEGAAELDQIIDEAMLGGQRVRQMVADLVERDLIEPRKQGSPAAGQGQRGPRRDLYFLTPKGESLIK